MAKYRIIKTVRGSSESRSVWVDKSTDEDVILAATALLRRGESAEVWGEKELIKRIYRNPVRTSGPKFGDVLAGLAMTISAGLLLMAMHDFRPNSAPDPSRELPLSATNSSTPDMKYIVSSESLPVRAVEAEAPPEAARLPQPPATTVSKGQHRRSNKPRLASAPGAPHTALFSAIPHSQTNVYGLMSPSFAQGGN